MLQPWPVDGNNMAAIKWKSGAAAPAAIGRNDKGRRLTRRPLSHVSAGLRLWAGMTHAVVAQKGS
jgi:hypothetical protein